jgi:subtilisin-like proprotein convertase family protein
MLVLLLAFAAVAFSRPTLVRAQPQTFSNATPITIPHHGPATPFPSTIAVSGLVGPVSDVDVSLFGLGHTYPKDLDILLVGPGEQRIMLMSDVGGMTNLSGVNLTFDDAAPVTVPDWALIVSGTYQPTNVDSREAFSSPAPPGPYGTTLSVFNGTDPNGTWSLFVVDDVVADRGEITGGWSLTITTVPDASPPVVSVPADISVPASSPEGALVTYDASAMDEVDGALVPSCDPNSGSTFPLGPTTVTCTATDAAGNTGSASFSVTVVDATAPVLTVPATISVLATSPAGAVVSYNATATDDIEGVVPVMCAQPRDSTFRIGATTVTCAASDSAGNTSTANFQVVVGAPVISALNPNQVPLTNAPQSITIRGSNFAAGATVMVGMKTYPATVVSSTELRVSLVPRDVFVVGWLVVPSVKVTITNPGGVPSNSLTLYLAW